MRIAAGRHRPGFTGVQELAEEGAHGRCRARVSHDRGLLSSGGDDPRSGAVVTAENVIGLALAGLLIVYLVAALLFPERF